MRTGLGAAIHLGMVMAARCLRRCAGRADVFGDARERRSGVSAFAEALVPRVYLRVIALPQLSRGDSLADGLRETVGKWIEFADVAWPKARRWRALGETHSHGGSDSRAGFAVHSRQMVRRHQRRPA